MRDLMVLSGYVSPGRPGYCHILTLEGAHFEMKEGDIARRFPLDTNRVGAQRLFIKADAQLSVSMKARDFSLAVAVIVRDIVTLPKMVTDPAPLMPLEKRICR